MEEEAYLRENPHADRLREVARLARVEYGRFDYALSGDGLEIWEVNTNPTVGPRSTNPDRRSPRDRFWHLRQPGKRLFRQRFPRAWEALDGATGPEGGGGTSESAFRPPASLLRRARRQRALRTVRELFRSAVGRLAPLPLSGTGGR